ncbi:threonine-phosphate decarboxylase CobD [Paenibacillus lentus]|uniref:threonine-phosphate decarboxylase n=1 Tax=Paenibacillus lentus TaxID=1338368 RepID=A0A3S8S1T3_9BACL|nr:threonine-phosphate decarboxylase CobD [Paenibacillus lentus]AZK49156.1 threonine-phosphate decarboxylase [Paenibacillus lentus]
MLEVYGHGGDVESAALRYGLEPGQFTDFSANINPLGPPPGMLEALQAALPEIVRYPDPGHRALLSMLAERHGASQGAICVGNGAAEIMSLILLALAPNKVGVVQPCFSEYETLSRQFGAEVQMVYGIAERDYRAAPEQIVKLMASSDLVFLGQPNNPNGVQYEVEQLRLLAESAEQQKTYLVLDEAFIDFIPAERRQSLLPELEQYPHVILVRSMTKFYAIPGLRLGYGIAHPQIIAAMRSKQVTWSVNILALRAGEISLQAGEEYVTATISAIAKERKYLASELGRLGCEVTPGEANYLLLKLPAPWTAGSMQEALGRRGVLVRSCAMYPGLDEGHIRVAVKDRAANTLLIGEMQLIIGGGEG